jgi:hypothetical protein
MNKERKPKETIMRCLILALCSVTFLTGCATFPSMGKMKLSNPLSKKEKKPEPYPNPVKMAVTWTPDTLTTPGKRPTRGFGGRIFFYNEKSQPVPVEGELTVVAYLEGLTPDEPARVRRFGFTKEQFTEHFSQSDLGASYSVWIPWDVDGGLGQRITMVPQFQPLEAKNPIQGSPTAVLLPGPMPEQEVINAARRLAYGSTRVPQNAMSNEVRQAGFADQRQSTAASPQVAQNVERRGTSTLTIPVDNSFNRNLRR